MLNVFAVPGEVFEEIKASAASTATWLAPALIFVLVSWVGTWLIFSQDTFKHQLSEITDQAVQKSIEKAHMSKEQAEQARQMAEKMASISSTIGAYGGALVVAFASPFFWGLIVWLVGTKALKADFPFMKAVEVVGLGNTIAVLEAIVKVLLILGLGNLFASPSLALVVKDFDPQNPSHSLLAVVDVMTFWLLAVRSVGLARLSGVPFAKAGIWIFGIWATYTGLFAGLGFALRAAFGR
jgi:hypothetical protein